MRHRRPRLPRLALAACGLAGAVPGTGAAEPAAKPNILWLMAEDMCPDLSCYGVKAVQTPHLDRLAAQGARYTHAFCTSPVCSPSRSAMMTGMHQNTIGAHQHRTAGKKPLADGIRPITHYLKEAGYYTAIGCGHSGKTDLNFTTDPAFDGKDWKERKPGQPFFAQISFANTHRAWGRDTERPIDPATVEIPPCYPDHPVIRRDWANGLEEIQKMDRLVGGVLQRLEDEGIADSTLVFFIGDNGQCHIRGKQFLYDAGLHVPLLVRWPGRVRPGTVCGDLVLTIDISAALLRAAGCALPAHLQGRDFLDPATPKRTHVFAARDKMDDTHDAMRTVRTKDFSYILNLMPERAWCQLNPYKESAYPALALMNVLHLKGQLTPEQDRFMQPAKPAEELYDLRKDPHELRNVAEDPAYRETLETMRTWMAEERKAIHDAGVTEEFRKGGLPSTYPTKTLAEWEAILQGWEAHLFEGKPRPGAKERPARRK